jgi:RimJ/RimL family protein N-acetyltransferase
MRLDLGECSIRDWLPGDASSLARHANNRKVWRNLRDAFPHPYRYEHAVDWLNMVKRQDPRVFFCIASEADEAIGGIGFSRQADVERFGAELGYWLSEEYWGRGITTRAVEAVTQHAFDVHGLRRVYALPLAWNPASARVLEKAGYQLEGRLRSSVYKDGQWVDQFLYAKINPVDPMA